MVRGALFVYLLCGLVVALLGAHQPAFTPAVAAAGFVAGIAAITPLTIGIPGVIWLFYRLEQPDLTGYFAQSFLAGFNAVVNFDFSGLVGVIADGAQIRPVLVRNGFNNLLAGTAVLFVLYVAFATTAFPLLLDYWLRAVTWGPGLLDALGRRP